MTAPVAQLTMPVLVPASAPAEDASEFIGRAAQRAQIDEFLKIKNRILVFVAPPGIGKTALIQAIEREHRADARPYIAHYCDSDEGANPFVFCTALSAKIQQALGADHFVLTDTARRQQVTIQTSVSTGAVANGAQVTGVELHVGGMHPREAFRQFVREPLRAYHDALHGASANEPLVILIDALDCAWDWDNGQLSNIVAILTEAQDLPPWVNIVCTARPGPAVQSLQQRAGVRVCMIDPLGAANLDDIRTFVHERFLATLEASDCAVLDAALVANNPGGDQLTRFATFVEKIVAASQGSFLFVRRYIDALRGALGPNTANELATLVCVDQNPDSLAATLDANYAAVFASVFDRIQQNPSDADADVLAVLAIAYGPVSQPVIERLAACASKEVADSLTCVAPLLAPFDADAPQYMFYHSGFAEYYRRVMLKQAVRDWNTRAALALNDSDPDPAVQKYSLDYRWKHLQRSLRLDWPQPSDTPAANRPQPEHTAVLLDVAQVQAQVRQPVQRAQVLRSLALQALDPAMANVPGSWKQAIDYLRAAKQTLQRSRALRRNRRRYSTSVPPELIEFERTLTALGDAYIMIGQRMDPQIPARARPHGAFQLIHGVWDAFARLPLTLFLLIVLVAQGVREVHIPGALQNLGRGQDWTVAKLYVLAIAAYRRASALATSRGDDEAADDLTERLARLYTLMGAYEAAASAYAALMAQPTALTRQWHQAVWRLELGEVLLARDRPDQAVDMFTSARLTFESQETPVQFARTLSGLANGYYRQATIADQQADPEQATTLFDQSLAASARALEQWQRVTVLPFATLGLTDPRLGISAVGHQLWQASANQQLDDDQQQRARTLLGSIDERHYPQRFEHPLLRLFRLAMALLMPAYLLLGLLLAVQLPNRIEVRTGTDIVFAPPQINLLAFPDNIVTGRAPVPGALTDSALSTLTTSGVKLQAGEHWVTIDQLAKNTQVVSISRDLLVSVLAYYLSYLVIGLLLVFFSSPSQFQSYRPGRLVLTKQALAWRGIPGQRPVLDFWDWGRYELIALWSRFRHQQLPRIQQNATLPLDKVDMLIDADTQLFDYLLYDYSYTLVRAREPGYPEIVLDGTLVYYRELCDELQQRLKDRRKCCSVNLARNGWGIVFFLTLGYMLLLLLLLRVQPTWTQMPITQISYSLSNLYVLITPGLLLPLLWLFIGRPLGVSSARTTLQLPLLMTAIIGCAACAIVLTASFSLDRFGLRPDLALPTLAAGVLFAIAYYARPRPLRSLFPLQRSTLMLALLASAATCGLALLLFQIGSTLIWYDALVRGNVSFNQAVDDRDCDDNQCRLLTQAAKYYDRAVRFNPNDGDGFALGGLIALLDSDYDRAIGAFERAQLATSLHDQKILQLSNIATVQMLEANQWARETGELTHYQQALDRFAQALAQADQRFNGSAASCEAIGQRLVPDIADVPWVMRQPIALETDNEHLLVGEFADTCLNLGLNRARAIASKGLSKLDAARSPEAAAAWRELAAAAVAFRAAADYIDKTGHNADTEYEYQDALKGVASSWLQLSQFANPPANLPDRRTAALMALRVYQKLQQDARFDDKASVAIGAAWSALELGAWDVPIWDGATPSLPEASAQSQDDATFPAMQGLIKWFDSTQYPVPLRTRPSLAYTNAITEALQHYDEALRRGVTDPDHAFAIRSLLSFSLRNSQRGQTYSDADYGVWMQQALRDIDRAIAEAEQLGRAPGELAGLHYWRGRLTMSLALTWQEKLRGAHDWNELVPLYSRAYADFSAATASDSNAGRKKIYQDRWIPWSKALLNDATHIALTRAALREGDQTLATRELALAKITLAQQFDKTSAAVPDYSYLYSLLRLAANTDLPFANPFVVDKQQAHDALASFTQAISDTDSGVYILKASADNPFDARALVFAGVIDDLDALAHSNIALSPQQRNQLATMRQRVQARLDTPQK